MPRLKRSARRQRKLRYFFKRDGKGCFYCGRNLHFGNATLDHVIPQCMGGSNHTRNVVASCGGCNVKKGDQLWKSGGYGRLKFNVMDGVAGGM